MLDYEKILLHKNKIDVIVAHLKDMALDCGSIDDDLYFWILHAAKESTIAARMRLHELYLTQNPSAIQQLQNIEDLKHE